MFPKPLPECGHRRVNRQKRQRSSASNERVSPRLTAQLRQGSFGHQRERPDRAASRHFARRIASGKTAAESRRNGYILATFVGVSDCRRIDARAGLELPKRFARVLVERDEL